MLRVLATALAVLALTTSFIAPTSQAVTPGITLIGKGVVSGSALDSSGLGGNICQAGVPANCVPKALFGGFGSDIPYTCHDDVFIAAPDRGPFDGLTDEPYLDRFYFLHITTEGASLDLSAALRVLCVKSLFQRRDTQRALRDYMRR